MRKKIYEQGSALLVITIVLAAALLGVLGYVAWNSAHGDTQASTTQQKPTPRKVAHTPNTNSNSAEQGATKTGTLSGSLTYPAESIPADMKVYAVNLKTNKIYATGKHLKGSQFQSGVGYRLDVPAGAYYVYGTAAATGN